MCGRPRDRWRDNIGPQELQVGDVVGLTVWPGHLALVEEITRDNDGKPERLKVSSFNYGRAQGWIDRDCEVTKSFGIASTYWVTLAETTGYWRPTTAGK